MQSELLLIACEVLDIFFLILGLSSLCVTIACDVGLYTFGSEHTPYSQRWHCQTLCLSVMIFASPVSLSSHCNYVLI